MTDDQQAPHGRPERSHQSPTRIAEMQRFLAAWTRWSTIQPVRAPEIAPTLVSLPDKDRLATRCWSSSIVLQFGEFVATESRPRCETAVWAIRGETLRSRPWARRKAWRDACHRHPHHHHRDHRDGLRSIRLGARALARMTPRHRPPDSRPSLVRGRGGSGVAAAGPVSRREFIRVMTASEEDARFRVRGGRRARETHTHGRTGPLGDAKTRAGQQRRRSSAEHRNTTAIAATISTIVQVTSFREGGSSPSPVHRADADGPHFTCSAGGRAAVRSKLAAGTAVVLVPLRFSDAGGTSGCVGNTRPAKYQSRATDQCHNCRSARQQE
jgi:hypothetical protein